MARKKINTYIWRNCWHQRPHIEFEIMSHIIDDEYSEIVLYVTELRRKFYRKLENQKLVIEQQRDRIDYQQRQIDDQRVIIDELAWQIRDLRGSVRQCTEKIYERNGCSDCSIIRKDNNNSPASSSQGILNRQSHVQNEGIFRYHFQDRPIHRSRSIASGKLT